MRLRDVGIVFAVGVLSSGALGCALSDRLAGRRQPQPAAVAVLAPTRTPWPTFTATALATPTPLPTSTPTNTTTPTPTWTPMPTDTPTPVPTDTPKPPLAPQPAEAAPPAEEAPAAAPAAPEYQYSPEAWEGQWNAGLAQIRGKIRDASGQPVQGVFVQARCGGTTIASNPSGINLYAPGEPFEAGAYDMILSSPLDPNSMCNWEVRVIQASSFEEAKDPGAPGLSPVGYCDLTTWGEMSICFANWRKNW